MPDHAAERVTHKRLPIAKVFLGAFLIPWYQRTLFFRSLVVLVVCQILLVLAWRFSGTMLTTSSAWLLYTVDLMLFTLVAVRCHRLILLDAGTENVFELPKWTWRETRFLGYLYCVWLIMTAVYMVAMMVIAIPAVYLLGAAAAEEVPSYVGYLASIPAYYLCGRFCLTLPAIAIDAASGPGVAWALSAGNGWRLGIVAGVLPVGISYLVGLIYLAEANVMLDVVYAVLSNVLIVVEVAVLSLSYRELR